MNRGCFTACVLAGVWSVAGAAQEAKQGVLTGLQSCATKQDDAARLSCYDAEMARLSPAVSADATKSAVAPGSTLPVVASAEEKFGFRGDVARETLDQKAAADPKVEQLTSTIAALSSRPRGERVVTLANGQVWAQKAPDTAVRLKVGDEVTIKPGTFGSFRMVSPAGRSTLVSREQ